jgi:hypothetical protein
MAPGVEVHACGAGEFAIDEGARRLRVVAERDNEPAGGCFRGAGFVPVASELLELILSEPS